MPYSFSRKASRSPWSSVRRRSSCGIVIVASCRALRNEPVSDASAVRACFADIGGCTVRILSSADIGARLLSGALPAVAAEIGLRNGGIAPYFFRRAFRDLAPEVHNVNPGRNIPHDPHLLVAHQHPEDPLVPHNESRTG